MYLLKCILEGNFWFPEEISMIPAEFIELNALAKDEGRKFSTRRFVFSAIESYLPEKTFIALVGPRGAGKTILLKQIHAVSESSFYISIDTQKPQDTLFSFARELLDRGIRLLLIDKVHRWPHFNEEIKKIFDFLDLKIIFSSSSAFSLYQTSVDLSRRIRIITVPAFSFREFIYFRRATLVPSITMDTMIDLEKCRRYYGSVLEYEPLFEEFLRGKNYPFSMNTVDILPLLKNILDKIVNDDLIFAGCISLEESLEARKVLSFIGKSAVEDINYTSISRNTGITKYKVEKFAGALEKSFIIRRIFPRGTSVSREPKILLALPYRLLFKSFDDCIGALREDFFVDMVFHLDHELYYLKSVRGEKMPDYLFDDLVIEIGGKHKNTSQFKGIRYSKKLIFTQPGILDNDRRPLFLMGMI
jgi:uncharacterized protein